MKAKKIIEFIRNNLAAMLLGLLFVFSAVLVVANQAEVFGADIILLRIGHWQLEPGVRDAFNRLAKDYNKYKPNVRIRQDAIPEGVYGQWVTTQLMGGTAPDILEMGLGLPPHIWLSYAIRYFHVLTPYMNKPNPYNTEENGAGDLANIPLMKTIKDGMRNGYNNEMQEFMSFGLAQISSRIFYNKTLLREITGSDKPITNYREFLDICKKIRSTTNVDTGRAYLPIASSKYHYPAWENFMIDPITYSAIFVADFDRSGDIGIDEQYVAFKAGILDMDFEPYKARFMVAREICDQFQTGFTGLGRDEAVFPFLQGKAVFLITGTYEANMLIEQTAGKFEIGVMDFPAPYLGGDPVYDEMLDGVTGPRYEVQYTYFNFGVTRTSKHPDTAIDFLQFLASRKYNEKFNEINNWIPCVKGAEMSEFLEPFAPNYKGIYKAINFNLGGETWIRYLQLFTEFQVAQTRLDPSVDYEYATKTNFERTFQVFTNEFIPFYIENGRKDYIERNKDWRRSVQKRERFVVSLLSMFLYPTGEHIENTDKVASTKVKYRGALIDGQLYRGIALAMQTKLIDMSKEEAQKFKGPYEYEPEVKKKYDALLRKNGR